MTRPAALAEQIAAELARGDHGGPRERFLTVRQLAERYRVSLVTAHRVLKRLKDRGLLVADSTNPARISPAAVSATPPARGAGPRRLGMVVTNIANPFFSRLCRQVQQAAASAGYQVLLADSQYTFARERKAVESLREIGVEGLLVVPGLDEASSDYYRELIAGGLRLVFISRQVEQVAADYVVADSFAGSAAVAGHLVSMGYDSFGYIGFASRLRRDARLSGFRAALVDEGMELADSHTASAEGGTIEHGYSAMKQLMGQARPPRAVFAFHDLLAIGALRYCQEHQVAVPHQVAIAGFDNLPESRVTTPPLTTVSYPIESMARLAIQCLTEPVPRDVPPRPNHRILLEPHLIVRQSTDPAAAPEPAPRAAEENYEML